MKFLPKRNIANTATDKPMATDSPGGYYNRARDFETVLEDVRAKSEKRAWFVAKLMCALACLAIIAVASLAPFYKLVPLVFTVDKNTGEAQMVDVLDAKHVNTSELEDKHYVEDYVRHREQYLYPLLQIDYDTVRNMSDDAVKTAYSAQFQGPDALDKSLGEHTIRTIKNLVTILPPSDRGVAIVSFDRITQSQNTPPAEPEHFVVTMNYKYKPNMFTREDIAINNPKGFKVTAYRRDLAGRGGNLFGTGAPGAAAGAAAAPAPAPASAVPPAVVQQEVLPAGTTPRVPPILPAGGSPSALASGQ